MEPELAEYAKNGSILDPQITFGDLQHNTMYQFRVRALTSVGPGPFSDTVTASTPPNEKQPPSKTIVIT